MKKLKIITVTAENPYSMGIQYGEQAKEQIERCLEYYKDKFISNGHEWERVRKCAMEYYSEVEKLFPDQAEEVRGIAAGSGVTVEDIMVINSRYEISKFPKLPECTTGAVLPEATADHTTYAIKNWDFNIQAIDHVVFLVIRQKEFWMAGFTEAGQMIRDGVNNYGIALCANNLQSVEDHYGMGMPVTFMRRRILYSKCFEEAERVLLGTKRTISNNILIVDGRNGIAKDYEWYPSGADVLEPEHGIVTHANHFVKNPERDALIGRPKNRDTRLREILMKNYGKIEISHLKEALRDHEYYPLSICAHPGDPNNSYTKDRATVSSMIVDFAKNEIHACLGAPCEGEYSIINM